MDDNNIDIVTNHNEPETDGAKRHHRARNWLMAVGATAAAGALTKAAEVRLRRMADPEAGEVLSEPLGEKGHYVKSFDGTRIYTEEIGEGPMLVLVHGWFCNTDMLLRPARPPAQRVSRLRGLFTGDSGARPQGRAG
jgi:hypothetical protein